MTLNYLKDPAQQVPNLPAYDVGLESSVRFYNDGTDEVKNLLKNECCVIYECSYCRQLFRSIINFISHKRTICRSLLSTVRVEQHERYLNDLLNRDDHSSSKTKKCPALRRFNMVGNLSKHIKSYEIRLENADSTVEIPTLPKPTRAEVLTNINDGVQVVDQLNLEIRNQLPEDRCYLVMPQENGSARYADMQLRRRQTQNKHGKKGLGFTQKIKGRNVTKEEIEIIERIPDWMLVDYQELRCSDPRCVGLAPFSNITFLANHLTVYHSRAQPEEAHPYRCFICETSFFKSLAEFKAHHEESHGQKNVLYTNNDESSSDVPDERMRKTLEAMKNHMMNQQRRQQILPIANNNKRTEKVCNKRFTNSPTPLSKSHKINGNLISSAEAMQIDAILNSSSRSREPVSSEKSQSTEENDADGGEFPPGVDFSDFANVEEEDDDSGHEEQGAEGDGEDEEEDQDKKIGNDISLRRQRQKNKRFFGEEFVDSGKAIDIRRSNNSFEKYRVSSPIISHSPLKAQQQRGGGGRQRRQKRPLFDDDDEFLEVMENSPAKKRTIESVNKQKTASPSPTKSPEKRQSKNSSPLKQSVSSSRYRQKQLRRGLLASSSTTFSSPQQPQPKKQSSPVKLSLKLKSPQKKSPVKKISVKSFSKRSFSQEPLIIKSLSTEVSLNKVGKDKEFSNSSEEMSQIKVSDQDVSELNVSPSKSSSEPPNNRLHSPFDDLVEIKNENEMQNEKDSNYSLNSINDQIILPDPQSRLTLTREQLPSRITDRSRENLEFYTPRARKARMPDSNSDISVGGRWKHLNSSINFSGDVDTSASSESSLDMLGHSKRSPPPKPTDLSEVPVYLTEVQRDLFFAPLKPLYTKSMQSDGLHQCGECGATMKSIRDGRRHMVSHIRVMRIRCSLCEAGAFFCSDMRVHLMFRHCEKLHLAPEGFVIPGNIVPCMDKSKADILTQLVDPYHPGRVMYTSGMIVSFTNPIPYYPDPKIEERILGKARPSHNSFMNKQHGHSVVKSTTTV